MPPSRKTCACGMCGLDTCQTEPYDIFNSKAWMRRALAAEAELERVVAVLPGPIWDHQRTLVWSCLDIGRIKSVLEGRR